MDGRNALAAIGGASPYHAMMVRAGGLEPPRAFAQRIFLPATAFAAAARQGGVRGLDYPFTSPDIRGQVLPV